MFKPSVLGLAVLLSSTALWSAFINGSLSVTTALIRFLIAVPVAAIMVHAFNLVLRVNASRARRPPQPAAEAADAGLEAG
ncbi:MAG: hypothetical protein ACJ74U_02005 [Jatrophihabitantaceae bacterium]